MSEESVTPSRPAQSPAISLVEIVQETSVAEPMTTEQMGNLMLSILRTGAPAAGLHNAKAMLAAAATFLREEFGDPQARQVLSSVIDTIRGTEILHALEPSSATAN